MHSEFCRGYYTRNGHALRHIFEVILHPSGNARGHALCGRILSGSVRNPGDPSSDPDAELRDILASTPNPGYRDCPRCREKAEQRLSTRTSAVKEDQMTEEDPKITAIKTSLRSGFATIALVPLIIGPAKWGAQVMDGRKKVGPLLIPGDDGLPELLKTLGEWTEGREDQ